MLVVSFACSQVLTICNCADAMVRWLHTCICLPIQVATSFTTRTAAHQQPPLSRIDIAHHSHKNMTQSYEGDVQEFSTANLCTVSTMKHKICRQDNTTALYSQFQYHDLFSQNCAIPLQKGYKYCHYIFRE